MKSIGTRSWKIARRHLPRLLPLVAVMLLFLAAEAVACPNCKDQMAENGGLAQGFYYTILGMVGMPFLLFGVVSTIVYRAHVRRGSVE